MAYPEKMTLTCGRTEYRGGSEGGGNEDGITSRKAEVRVTYRLERRDVDLLHAVAVAARELDAAQDILWHEAQGRLDERIRERSDGSGDGQVALPLDERDAGKGDAGEEADDGDGPADADAPPYYPDSAACGPDDDDPASEDDDPAFYAGPFYDGEGMDEDTVESMGGATCEDAPDDGPPSRTGGAHRSEVPPSGSYACQTAGARTPGNGFSGEGSAGGGAGAMPVPVTKPQTLAISAACRRLGLSDAAVAEVIRERFGKESATPRYAVNRLSKREADTLLRALTERE